MTDHEEVMPAPADAATSEAPALTAAKAEHREAMTTRVLIPLLLPVVSAVAILVYVLNLSRALLAGGKWGSLTIASIITVTILFGAAWISARPRMRTSTLVLLVSTLVVLIVASGFTSLGPSQEKEAAAGGGYVPPKGAAVDSFAVQALPTTKFDQTQFTVKAGVVQVNYSEDSTQSHTLAFTDPAFNGFLLKLPEGPKAGKVELKPGKYTIYCTLPGHRQLGMEATVTVQ